MIFKDDKKKIRKKVSDKKKEISESPIDFTIELFSLSVSVEWKEQWVVLPIAICRMKRAEYNAYEHFPWVTLSSDKMR